MFIYEESIKKTTYNEMANLFSQRFGVPAPERSNCYAIAKRIKENYTAINLNLGRSGCPKNGRSDGNIFAVMGDVASTPEMGNRRREVSLDIPRTKFKYVGNHGFEDAVQICDSYK